MAREEGRSGQFRSKTSDVRPKIPTYNKLVQREEKRKGKKLTKIFLFFLYPEM